MSNEKSNSNEAGRVEAAGDQLKLLASKLKTLIHDATSDEDAKSDDALEAETLLRDAVDARATDIHLDPTDENYLLRFRVDGEMIEIGQLDFGFGRKIVNQLRALAKLNPIRAMQPESGHFGYRLDEQELDVRVTEAPCVSGDKLAVRLLAPARILSDIEELGIDESGARQLHDWLETIGGLLLTVGPTGSGKTTTLYALLHWLKTTDAEVVTLEHPVEYSIPRINQMAVNPEQGLDFTTGSKGMLRLDPDFMVVGELRDQGSAEAAINAVGGGKATMASLHARDAVDCVSVLRNFGLNDHEIASNLDLVVSQRLVRRLCPSCRTAAEPAERDLAWLKQQGIEAPEKVYLGSGCQDCGGLGAKGRIGVFEIWHPSDEDYERIVQHEPIHRLREALARRGHRFLIHDGVDKVRDGIISLRDLRRVGAPEIPCFN
jgi:type II secretory ATPase GspE/PulE/Tfp pilus assembly ATPase PilB-like protein